MKTRSRKHLRSLDVDSQVDGTAKTRCEASSTSPRQCAPAWRLQVGVVRCRVRPGSDPAPSAHAQNKESRIMSSCQPGAGPDPDDRQLAVAQYVMDVTSASCPLSARRPARRPANRDQCPPGGVGPVVPAGGCRLACQWRVCSPRTHGDGLTRPVRQVGCGCCWVHVCKKGATGMRRR